MLLRLQSKTQNLASMSKSRAVGAADYRFFFNKKNKKSPQNPGNALSGSTLTFFVGQRQLF